jgi:hemolysin III
MRGVLHQYAAIAAVGGGIYLVAQARPGPAAVSAAVYAACLVTMLCVSALYHRPMWSLERRKLLRRVDHATIFLLIAGTYTPMAAAVLAPPRGPLLLKLAWAGAALGIARTLFWPYAPRAIQVGTYLALGWMAALFLPDLRATLGFGGVVWLIAGGTLYTVGALVYALRRPNPVPHVFGYHEVFHAFVILAAVCHFVLVFQAVGAA